MLIHSIINYRNILPDIKLQVKRIHNNGSGYADTQTVTVILYLDNEEILNKSMTNSSAYDQAATYLYPEN